MFFFIKILKYFKNPRLILFSLLKKIKCYLSDKFYLSLYYRLIFGHSIKWRELKTFNEKLQWLKLYDRRSEYTNYVDKYKVREYISKTIGEEYLIPLLGVWDSVDEIDFEKLPNQFVLKCNHDSGGLCICKDKSKLNVEETKNKLRKSINNNYYYSGRGREWPYKNVPRKIVAEKFMEDKETKELRDYKFFCFDGVAKAVFIASERQNPNEETKFDFFDMDFNHLDFINGHPMAKVPPKKPKNFELMKELAEKLSKGIPQIRIDFYEINGKVYFGEMTLFHWSGLMPFKPEKWDYIFGSWIKLSQKNKHI